MSNEVSARLATKGFHFYEGDQKWLPCGVTYGPFPPGDSGDSFPSDGDCRRDFEMMRAHGINAIRVYNVPTDVFAELAAEYGLRLLVDISWPKHLDVYESKDLREMCVEMVIEAIRRIRDWPNLIGAMLGNEVPADLVRWHGPRRVEAFLEHLYDVAKREAPELLLGYANFPSTEFLQPRRFDFVGFNVYLDDADTFRSYLIRLRHMYPDCPLVLSEVGMDSIAAGEVAQAAHLETNLAIAYEVGMAGAFVFSWTDEWHTGGYDITDWAFGLTDANRKPKAALAATGDVYARVPQCLPLEDAPRISVVVATYNGASTLRECLQSLQALKYPDFEIVVVDDGSTDETGNVLKEFSGLMVVTQENEGLSAARNAGVAVATGEIVAFTDSDCYADPDWLYHLAREFSRGDFAAVGGPNLTPSSDGLVARCVAAAPGHATHVLVDAEDAEHIPGCNMAFRKRDLDVVGGFDPVFSRAGDDVDIAWRLQDLHRQIGFSTAAFVWHHRRSTALAYLRQQAGYGEAEADLLRTHPHRFNDRGQSQWKGMLYGGGHGSTLVDKPNVHYGVFGSAQFQCIYQQPGSILPHALTSLEWWILCVLLIGGGFVAKSAMVLGLIGIVISLGINGVWAKRSWKRVGGESVAGFLVTCALWTLQPIVRSGARYWGRIGLEHSRPAPGGAEGEQLNGRHRIKYWAEESVERVELIRRICAAMVNRGWVPDTNTAWESWDFSVPVSWWFRVRIRSAQEDHGAQKGLLMMRYRMAPSSLLWIVALGVLVFCLALAMQDTVLARYVLAGTLGVLWLMYRIADRDRRRLEAIADGVIRGAGYERMEDESVKIGLEASKCLKMK